MAMTDPSELYKIGAVAKLTGIAVERLRAWERRYGLTPASREGKTRFYSTAQVERLTRIKRLIDQGHPVSTLINLGDEALNERLQQINSTASHSDNPLDPSVARDHQARVGLIGTQLLMLEQSQAEPARINVVARWVNLAVATPELSQAIDTDDESLTKTPEVLVVLLGSLTPTSVEELANLAIKTLPVVVYHYATEEGLAEAAERDWQALRWPASWSDVEQAVLRQTRSALRAAPIAARRFSDEQLLSIASSGPALGCACPADLVNLISALNAFSEHSAACSNPSAGSSKAGPARARAHESGHDRPGTARHSQIAQRTSQARLELELVLEDWVTTEGLLPVPN